MSIFLNGLSGTSAAAKSLANASNNIANATTTSFKSQSLSFQEIYSGNRLSDPRLTVGSGVDASQLSTDFTPGAILATGNATDFAIAGSSFFATKNLNRPQDGITYTRDGRFAFDVDGYLSNTEGEVLLDAEGEPIRLPEFELKKTTSSYDIINSENFDPTVDFNKSELTLQRPMGEIVDFAISEDIEINNDIGAISVVSGNIYLGQGGFSDQIGAIRKGLSGNLVVNFNFQKETKNTADFSDTSWVGYENLIDPASELGQLLANSSSWDMNDFSSILSTENTSVGLNGNSASLSTGLVNIDSENKTNPYWNYVGAGVRGPYVVSSDVTLSAGDEISLLAQNSYDQEDNSILDVLLVDKNSNEIQRLFDYVWSNVTPASEANTDRWTAVSGTVETDGVYDVYVSGGGWDDSVDEPGDYNGIIADTLTIKDFSITSKTYPRIEADVVDKILSKVSLSNATLGDDTHSAIEGLSGAVRFISGEKAEFSMTAEKLSTEVDENFKTRLPLSRLNTNTFGEMEAGFARGMTATFATIGLASVLDPTKLQYLGNGKYALGPNGNMASLQKPDASSTGTIISGALETSNTDIVSELSAILLAQQNFQANSKALSSYIEALKLVEGIR